MLFLDWHYFRNLRNEEGLATEKMSAFKSMWHGGQAKYVSPDGHHEAVYDRNGKLVGGRYGGTYNYYSANGSPAGHFFKDVVPHVFLGP